MFRRYYYMDTIVAWFTKIYMTTLRHVTKIQRHRNISRRKEIQMTNILELELFNIWCINFIGPFMSSHGMILFLLLTMIQSGWRHLHFKKKERRKVSQQSWRRIFFPNFSLLGFFSDEGSHLFNLLFKSLLRKYFVKHEVEIPYHSLTSGQVEFSNQEIKSITVKTIIQ